MKYTYVYLDLSSINVRKYDAPPKDLVCIGLYELVQVDQFAFFLDVVCQVHMHYILNVHSLLQEDLQPLISFEVIQDQGG